MVDTGTIYMARTSLGLVFKNIGCISQNINRINQNISHWYFDRLFPPRSFFLVLYNIIFFLDILWFFWAIKFFFMLQCIATTTNYDETPQQSIFWIDSDCNFQLWSEYYIWYEGGSHKKEINLQAKEREKWVSEGNLPSL